MCEAKYQRIFDFALSQIIPLNAHEPPDPTAINVTNMVASVHTLAPGTTISPKRLVLAARGAAKYSPQTFQSVVLRFGSRLGNATGLVTMNGKLTIVGAKNRNHARFAAQQYRLFIEQTHDMEGQCRFEHFQVYAQLVCAPALDRCPRGTLGAKRCRMCEMY
jgi:TATA-box binding protein (TBP) (component of TFIID and TFIIIB)